MNAYKKHRTFTFKSAEQAWVAGGKGSLDFEGWVETKGPNGYRTVIDGFSIHALFNMTVTVTDLDHLDKWMILRGLTIEQIDGTKRYDDMPGDALRIALYGLLGANRVKEQVTQTAGSGAADTLFSCYVPMTKPFAHEPLDFALGADLFKRVAIRQAVASDFQSGTVVINSGRYWVVAHCHEEKDVVQHAVDTVVIRDFDSTNETAVNVYGRPTDCYVYAPGTPGGQNFSDIQDARIVELQQDARYTMPDLAFQYELAREQATNGAVDVTHPQGQIRTDDPFIVTSGAFKAIPILFSDGNKIDEIPEVGRMHIKLTPGTPPGGAGSAHTGTLRAIVRTVEPRSEKLERAVANKYKATKSAPKVAKVTNSAPDPKAAKYMPAQFRK